MHAIAPPCSSTEKATILEHNNSCLCTVQKPEKPLVIFISHNPPPLAKKPFWIILIYCHYKNKDICRYLTRHAPYIFCLSSLSLSAVHFWLRHDLHRSSAPSLPHAPTFARPPASRARWWWHGIRDHWQHHDHPHDSPHWGRGDPLRGGRSCRGGGSGGRAEQNWRQVRKKKRVRTEESRDRVESLKKSTVHTTLLMLSVLVCWWNSYTCFSTR